MEKVPLLVMLVFSVQLLVSFFLKWKIYEYIWFFVLFYFSLWSLASSFMFSLFKEL